MKMKTALETKKMKTKRPVLTPLLCVLIISFGLHILSVLKSISGVTSETEKQNFELAESESGGFFTDVSSYHWNLMKAKVKAMSPNYNPEAPPFVPEGGKIDPRNREAGWFYQNHYEPDFVCQHERRIGKLGDGGKWVCDPHRITQKSSCLVYSVGSFGDFSFEESVQTDIGSHCEIHTFDFGDYKGAKEAGVHYHQYGLGVDSIEGDKVFKSLSTIVQELGHEGRTIDIFKIDCEGCEWSTVSEWFKANVELKQIQVELHLSKFPETADFFKSLYANHYVITHKEHNVISLERYGSLPVEYAFLKLTAQFFD